ncbi:hypothetical protein J3F83DRAFT_644712 [Trichoderma novae-zelandiae]
MGHVSLSSRPAQRRRQQKGPTVCFFGPFWRVDGRCIVYSVPTTSCPVLLCLCASNCCCCQYGVLRTDWFQEGSRGQGQLVSSSRTATSLNSHCNCTSVRRAPPSRASPTRGRSKVLVRRTTCTSATAPFSPFLPLPQVHRPPERLEMLCNTLISRTEPPSSSILHQWATYRSRSHCACLYSYRTILTLSTPSRHLSNADPPIDGCPSPPLPFSLLTFPCLGLADTRHTHSPQGHQRKGRGKKEGKNTR